MTVDDYLDALPDDRRDALAQVREVVRGAAPDAAESVRHGMRFYELHGDLCAIASQKNHMSFHMLSAGEPLSELRARTSLDIGKGCVRFGRLEDLPLDLIGAAVAEGVAANEARAGESS